MCEVFLLNFVRFTNFFSIFQHSFSLWLILYRVLTKISFFSPLFLIGQTNHLHNLLSESFICFLYLFSLCHIFLDPDGLIHQWYFFFLFSRKGEHLVCYPSWFHSSNISIQNHSSFTYSVLKFFIQLLVGSHTNNELICC